MTMPKPEKVRQAKRGSVYNEASIAGDGARRYRIHVRYAFLGVVI
jgi:hypothetical protein